MKADFDSLTLDVQIGKRIAFLRKERKISQLDFSLMIGSSQSYLNDLENGRRNPSLGTLAKIAKALGITLSILLQGIDVI